VKDQTPPFQLMEAKHEFSAVKPINGWKLEGELCLSLFQLCQKKTIDVMMVVFACPPPTVKFQLQLLKNLEVEQLGFLGL
jgi:hypothetical protein